MLSEESKGANCLLNDAICVKMEDGLKSIYLYWPVYFQNNLWEVKIK